MSRKSSLSGWGCWPWLAAPYDVGYDVVSHCGWPSAPRYIYHQMVATKYQPSGLNQHQHFLPCQSSRTSRSRSPSLRGERGTMIQNRGIRRSFWKCLETAWKWLEMMLFAHNISILRLSAHFSNLKFDPVAGTGNRYNSRYTSMVDLQMDLKWSQSLDLMSGQVGHIPNEFRKPARAIYKSIIWELQKPLVQIS